MGKQEETRLGEGKRRTLQTKSKRERESACVVPVFMSCSL